MKKYFKNILLFSVFLFLQYPLFSQVKTRNCSTKMRKTAPARVDSTILKLRKSQLRLAANETYMIKLFVVIFADDDGSNRAADVDDVRRQIEFMTDYYRPHNICFLLAGTQQSNNTDHNSQFKDTEEDEVAVYRRTGYITILVHANLINEDNESIGGTAYGIPNNYLSIRGNTLTGTTFNSTLSHEIGHNLGLYHTFETVNGEEHVPRTGDCKNCEDNGDYLCDTQADALLETNEVDATNCNYIGSANRTNCVNQEFPYETENIMAYGRVSCHNHFTNGQGARMRDFLVSEADLSAALAVENLVQSFPRFYDDGLHMYGARNSVTFDLGYEATGTARISISANEIIMKPGVEFRPTAGVGYAILRPNTFCD
jgi:hypothetical protein